MSREAGTLITLGDLHLGSFRKVKSLLLLVFVGLEGPAPRRQLAALLWPRAAKPEGSLRVALHALREHDGSALGGDERLVAGVACDASALLTLRGEAAWEAYRGPFLHGVNLPDVSGEFEEWVLAQRERLARHVQDEALRVAEGSEPGLAAVWAQRARDVPGAPPMEPGVLARLLPLTLPGSALEAEVRAELADLTAGAPAEARGSGKVPAHRMLGREAELDALLAWAAAPGGGAAVVVGPGGIGKSTLAREVLRELTRLERPVTLVNAEGAQSDADVAVRVAAACAPGRPVPQGFGFLRDVLGAGSVVLLDGLDALEDLPGLLRSLREDLPDVRWVLTGRRVPRGGPDGGLDTGTFLLPLAGLEQPGPEADVTQIAASGAAQLFVREAGRVRRDFTLGAGNAALIAGITRRLAGHPLAIALAASWLRVEDLDAVYARVLHEAGALTAAGGDSDGRRGLNVVAQRSWNLLPAGARAAALRLSVAPDFDPLHAPALGVTPDELDALLTHSFAEAYLPGSERLRLYPALGGLLAGQGAAHPDLMRGAREAHAAHYLGWFTARPPEDPAVDAERENILIACRAALTLGTLEAAHAEHLLAHHDRRGLHGSGTETFAALADDAEDAQAPAQVQAALQVACMWLAFGAGRLLDAQTLAGQFLAGPLAADPASRMKVLNTLSSVRGVQGQIQAAVDLLGQALALAVELGDRTRTLYYRLNLLTHLTFLGNAPELRLQLTALEAQLPDLPPMLAWQVRQSALGVRVYLPATDEERGAQLVEAGALLEAGRTLRVQSLEFHGHEFRTQLALHLRRWRQAEGWLAEWRAHIAASGQVPDETSLTLVDTELHYARGRTPQARRSARLALRASERSGNPWQVLELLLLSARDLSARDPDGLRRWLLQAAQAPNAHSQQRAQAGALLLELFGLPPQGSADLLDVPALRVWLTGHLAG